MTETANVILNRLQHESDDWDKGILVGMGSLMESPVEWIEDLESMFKQDEDEEDAHE